MNRLTTIVSALILFILPVVLIAQTPTSTAAGTLKEKIVFVHSDPTIGVISIRSITDVDVSGAVTGSHAAPEMDASSSRNRVKDEISLMNPDGSAVTPLHIFGSDPMISPDGTKIVYCSLHDTIYSQIFVMSSDGSSPKRLTDIKSGDACGPAWSHDGKKIAYYAFAQAQPSRNPEVWVMDSDGSNPRKLTEHGMDPSWSPDGKQIAFASRRDDTFQIYAMNADGSNVRRLTKNNAENSSPAWAPDGGSILYISATGDDRRGLFLMGADGSDPHGLAHSKHQDFCFPAWSLDGRNIIFAALNRVGSQGIVVGEERPRCEQWSGEYQTFAMDAEGKIRILTDARVMATHPSYGRVLSTR